MLTDDDIRRAARDSRRRNIQVPLWEDTDVSDIDCTPTYDTNALDEKIRAAQLKCQSLAATASEDEGQVRGPAPQSSAPGAAEEEFLGGARRELKPYHINGLAMAERICREMDVPFRAWKEAYAQQESAQQESAQQESGSGTEKGAAAPHSSIMREQSSLTSPAAGRSRQPHFGPDMFRGEGEAMAAFVASGQRIPRRGEVGWSPEDIERFERSGFVMSGNRNRRITNVRIRKEAEVYSAEQQRALSLYNYELRAQRERAVAQELQNLLKKGLSGGPDNNAAQSGDDDSLKANK